MGGMSTVGVICSALNAGTHVDAPGHFVNVRTSCMEPFQAHERDLDLAGLAQGCSVG